MKKSSPILAQNLYVVHPKLSLAREDTSQGEEFLVLHPTVCLFRSQKVQLF
jgi:hypothetical protein